MIAILIGYFLIVMVYWTKSKSFYFVLAGQSIWFLLLAYVCSFLGALQVPVFLIALTYSAAGFVYNMKYSENDMDESSVHETKNQSMLERCAHFWDSPIIKSTPNRQPTTTIVQPSTVQSISSPSAFAPDEVVDPTAVLKTKLELNLKTAGAKATTSTEQDSNQSIKSQSAIYFKGLFMACLVTILYKQLFVLALSFIPILVYFAKQFMDTFGIKEYLGAAIADLYAQVQVSQIFNLYTFQFNCISAK